MWACRKEFPQKNLVDAYINVFSSEAAKDAFLRGEESFPLT
jgi:hypothetical protein